VDKPTVAFEIVATPVSDGHDRLLEEAHKVRALLEKWKLTGRVNSVLVPQLIHEDGDRPIKLVDKIDPLEAQPTLAKGLPLDYILTQVTVFTPMDALRARLTRMRELGIEKVVFVGVPRVFDEKAVVGPYPNQALSLFADLMPQRGVVLIPTRPDEAQRFGDKLSAGATFGLCQLLFTDYIVGFLRELAGQSGAASDRAGTDRPERPELLLSFGYVPKIETERGLIRWLIRDTTPGAVADMAEVERLAPLSFKEKKARSVELYKRIVGEATSLGFPLAIHLEAPYGASDPAMETFAEMLDHWPG
jgi:hypothetical protein